MYRVCIIGAGRGTRVGEFTKVFNKAFLPIHGKPAIAHIVETYPEDCEIVFAIGYRGEQIKTYLETAFPNRSFIWVTVENYDGPGSGPGLSLLACENHLQRPFVLANVDAITTGEVPEPIENWFGVAEVEETERYCTVQVNETNTITRIDDKTRNNNRYAFIGIAGVFDYEVFWSALKGNTALVSGERQVSNGFFALREIGLKARVLGWYDTGVPEAFEETCRTFPKEQKPA